MKRTSFAAIIRTTFAQPAQLRESLEALTFQLDPCRAVVIVHAGPDAFRDVEILCRSIQGLDFVVLHASETNKKPGYAVNIGLEHCYSSGNDFQFVVFLDDAGMVYPFFTRVMSDTFLTTEAGVICGPWNRYYAVRFDALKTRKIWMDELLDRGADWHLLFTLLQHGFRLESNYSTLSADFVPDQKAQVSSLQSRIADLEHSWSWRLSLPLRIFGSIFADRKP